MMAGGFMNGWRLYELPPASAGGPATQHPASAKILIRLKPSFSLLTSA
jgi:hypothetical protein